VVRRFLTARWVTIHLLTVAIVVIFLFFGRWQLHRWEHRGISAVPPDSRPAVALADLVSPDQPLPGGSIGRQVTVTGHYDAASQVLVPGRELAGRSGFWVLTPMRPVAAPGGAAALVVRGWVVSPNDPALSAPTATVVVLGRLYASEDPPAVGTGTDAPLPRGQFREVNTAELTGQFPYRILDGYLLLGSQTPITAPAPAVLPVPLNQDNRGGGLYNLAYAIQWVLFSFAVLYFWVKLIRGDLVPDDEDRDDAGRTDEPAPTARQVPARVPATLEPLQDEDDDEELAAYNRYLADLNARSGRSSR
jgi:cytochrome oxidase assembly protein ShyY1